MNLRDSPERHALRLLAAMTLIVVIASRTADARPPQSPPTVDVVLPPVQVVFETLPASVTRVNQVPPFFVSRLGRRDRVDSPTTDEDGVIALPGIPFGEEIDPRLLDVLGGESMDCAIVAPSAPIVLRRDRTTGGTDTDEIALVENPSRDHAPGFVQISVPTKISRTSRGPITLSIHDWGELSRRVGAGIFVGEVVLSVRHSRLQGDQPLLVGQPITVVISGSRVLSVASQDPLRVGTKPEVRVVVESVDLVRPDAPQEIEPGWWLEAKQSRGEETLVRMPLPITALPSAPGLVFSVPGANHVRCWDTIEVPERLGYRLAPGWRGQLIVQRLEPVTDVSIRDDVRVRRQAVATTLPALNDPGLVTFVASFDSRNSSQPPGVAANPLTPPTATRWGVGPIAVGSGLRVSQTMPLTGEPFWIEAVVDTKTGVPPAETAASAPPALYVSVQRRNGPDAWANLPPLRLDLLPEEPDQASVVRYLSTLSLGFDAPGEYRFRLDAQAGADADDEEAAKQPPPWSHIVGTEITVRVAIEGEPGAPAFDSENPLKVFTDNQPAWWLMGEPNFTPPHQNDRTPGQVVGNRSLSFRGVAGLLPESMFVRYQGIFASTRTEGLLGPVTRYDGAPPNPRISLEIWDEGSGQPSGTFDDLQVGKAIPMGKPGGDRQFYNLVVDLNDLAATDRERTRSMGPQLRLARFAIVGLDSTGQPVGRIYTRGFEVWVRSVWDELWDVLDPTMITLVVVVLAIVGFMALRWLKERKRLREKRLRAENELRADGEPGGSPVNSPLDDEFGPAPEFDPFAAEPPRSSNGPSGSSSAPESSDFGDLGPSPRDQGAHYFDE